jgi:neutral ceramidase
MPVSTDKGIKKWHKQKLKSRIFLETNMWNYYIGTGISEVTDPTIGLQMQGFADDTQRTGGVELPLFSRAFMVDDPRNKKRIVIVCADIWAATNAVTQEVIKRLQQEFGNVYTRENVMIIGTHTHSAPGGYTGYRFYEITGKGFDEHTFEFIVSGIVDSIKKAHGNLGQGNIYLNKGIVENCGRNRSLDAYRANPEGERSRYPADTDNEMLLLKFTKQISSGQHLPVGVLNWYAIHPTDRGQQNRRVCGDNKAFASFLFEKAMISSSGPEPFVAAFANANAGDVSGNVGYSPKHNDIDDLQHMAQHGSLQYRTAKKLFDSASDGLSGSSDAQGNYKGGIDYRYKYVDMSNIPIEDPAGKRTWPAALGLSFAAGSTEDGVPRPPTGLREGITRLRAILPTEDAMLSLGAWAGTIFENIPNALKFSNEEQAGHFPKPILFAVGASEGLAPKILPLQIFRIGQLAIIGVPAELTTMAGRRLRQTVLNELADAGVQYVAIAGYANDYSQYITTIEEYGAQHYEGASTLFGPYTLHAYQQEFRKLARALKEGTGVAPGAPPAAKYSQNARRWTIRNLSKSGVNLQFYHQGDNLEWSTLPNGNKSISACSEVAFPEREFTGPLLPAVGRVKIKFNGAVEKIVEVNQLVTISDRDGIEITEYTKLRQYTPIGPAHLYSSLHWLKGSVDVGVYRSSESIFYLRSGAGPGFSLKFGDPRVYVPIVGDWNGKRFDSIGVFRPKESGAYPPSHSVFFLKDNYSPEGADNIFPYGTDGDIPIVGDWTGKGHDSIGVYRPSQSVFYLRNSNSTGVVDITFRYGDPGQGHVPIAGDWTGKGYDSIGLYHPSQSVFYLKNSNSTGVADITFKYGIPGDIPVVGDWTGKGYDSIGVYRPSEAVFYLRNNNSAGAHDITFKYGNPGTGDVPIVGKWMV